MGTEERIVVDLPVDAVTVLEDRAHVFRRGRFGVLAGHSRLVIEGPSPLLVDKTLTAKVTRGPANVASVRVERERVLPDPAQEIGRLDARLEELAREEDALEGDEALAQAQLGRLDEAAAMSLSEQTEDATWGRSDADGARSRLDALHRAEVARQEQLGDLGARLRKLRRTIDRLNQRRSALERPSSHIETRVVLAIEATEAAEIDVELAYLVPCAAWRPIHRARLFTGEQPRVVIESDGMIWQNTGEPWDRVQILFSTERPSLGSEPPALSSDLLSLERSGSRVVVEAREDEVHTASLGGQRMAREVPGVDDGGTPLRIKAPGRADIPSDGRPCRVPMFQLESSADVDLVCTPELTQAVIMRSRQVHTGAHALLAGPVDLIRDSGLVGRTQLLYVAPGERFELGWGPHPALRVHREQDTLPEEKSMLSAWTSVATRTRVRISNLGDQAHTLQLTERVPVSEVEKVDIAIEPEHTSPGDDGHPARPDADGFMRWTPTLAPFGHEDIHVGWVLRKHADVSGV